MAEPPRTIRECEVSVSDIDGFTHKTVVHASTLLHAAGLALKYFEENELLDGRELTGEVTVSILTRTQHSITLRRVRDWMNTPGGRSPREMMLKNEVRGRTKPA